jgi:hypothetical protein
MRRHWWALAVLGALVWSAPADAHTQVGHLRAVRHMELAGPYVVYANANGSRVLAARPGARPIELFKTKRSSEDCHPSADFAASSRVLAVTVSEFCYRGTPSWVGNVRTYAGPLLGPYRAIDSCSVRHAERAPPQIAASGRRIAFQPVTRRCKAEPRIVVRDALADRPGVRSFALDRSQPLAWDSIGLAGRYLAYQDRVVDTRTRRVVYRTGGLTVDDLAPSGRAAVTRYTYKHGLCHTERLGIAGLESLGPTWLTGPARCDATPHFAAIGSGGVAYSRRSGAERPAHQAILLDDLRGRRRTVASFRVVSVSQAFDGRRLAYTQARCDRSHAIWLDDVTRDAPYTDRTSLACRARAASRPARVYRDGHAIVWIVCRSGCYVEGQPFPPGSRPRRLTYQTYGSELYDRVQREGTVRERLYLRGVDRALRARTMRITVTFEKHG